MGSKSPDFTQLDKNNEYTTLDYSASGKKFVIAGQLPQVEVYDDITKALISMNQGVYHFHNSKIQTVKFYPNSDELYYSGGWDTSVKFWDIRQKNPTARIYGI